MNIHNKRSFVGGIQISYISLLIVIKLTMPLHNDWLLTS